MINKCHRSTISITIFSFFACLWFTFFAGCTGVAIKDDLPPSSPRGYADFANYTLGYDIIFSMKDGHKSKEGSLGFKGATLRLARTPGNYDFIIQHEDDSGKKKMKPVNVKIEQNKITFVTVDNRIIEVTDNTNEREPMSQVTYDLNISAAKTPAPLHFGPETARRDLQDLFNDPDWRARLHAVSAVEKMKNTNNEELIQMVKTSAADDSHRAVRNKAAALLKDLGIDPFNDVLFLENFEANDKRRWISSRGEYTYFYNDEFLMSSAPDACENQMLTSPLELPRAFTVELVSTWKAGAGAGAYGFVMGADKENYNHFALSAEGRAAVRPTRNNESSADLIEWTRVDSIDKHRPNRLTVEVRGNTWKYYVNGTYVGTLENTQEPETYTFGLRVCQGQTIAFDQVKISRVPEK